MEKKNLTLTWTEYPDESALEPGDRELLSAARSASENAYAPYSGFFVGAAVRLENGQVITGSNIENAAFPSGICAERNALSSSAAQYPTVSPVAIAIAARTRNGQTKGPVSPCGNCRQVMAEEEFRFGRNIRIILGGSSRIRVIEKCSDILPLQFNRDDMKLIP
ncbi:MAG: cytidine deaminase [Bacteroidales bacterium]